MLRIVLDTNILLVIIPKKSKYRSIYDALRLEKFELVVSNEILTEYAELLTRFYSQELAENVIEELLNMDNVLLQNVYYKFNLIAEDKDDNKFVDIAIASNADFIVTQDKHYNILNKIEFPKMNIKNILDFQNSLKPKI